MLEAREKNFVIYSVEGCGEIQKQEDRNSVIIESSENIVEYAVCCIPTLLQVAFLGKYNDQGLGPRCWPFCCLLSQIVARTVITSFHLLGPVLLRCCQLQLTSLSSTIALQLLCKGWGGRHLCLSGDGSVLMDLCWPCNCTTQSSILPIGSVSLVFQ